METNPRLYISEGKTAQAISFLNIAKFGELAGYANPDRAQSSR